MNVKRVGETVKLLSQVGNSFKNNSKCHFSVFIMKTVPHFVEAIIKEIYTEESAISLLLRYIPTNLLKKTINSMIRAKTEEPMRDHCCAFFKNHFMKHLTFIR